jgi:hypothetical protein
MRHNPAKGTNDCYYRLTESYRNFDDRVCHRTLLNVGFLNDIVTIDQLNLIRRQLVERQENITNKLFSQEENSDPVVNQFVNELWNRLIAEKRIDTGEKPPKKKGKNGEELEIIYTNSVKHSDIREIGSESMCLQTLEQLRLPEFLKSQGWSQKEIQLALTQIIIRAVHPASELATAEWIRENSAVCELTGFPQSKINKDCLYRMSKKLYGLHAELENHFSKTTNELFDIEDRIILYDLTNTYFEGRMATSKIAKHGRSKEKRSDCKLIVLALVINPQGFIKHSTLLEGNIADSKTLKQVVLDLRSKTTIAEQRAIVVMDAGIATEENLAMLKENNFDYLCVSRSTLKNYEAVESSEIICVEDKKHQKIELRKVTSDKKDDYFLKIQSEAKGEKERSMNARFKQGFEEGLERIKSSLAKKSGIKTEEKVYERIGRLKAKYPSIHKHYEISYQIDIQENKSKTKKNNKSNKNENENQKVQHIVSSIEWQVNDNEVINERSGIYFLRTSIQDSEKILWDTYNIIREIESTFRCLKTDLDLRPIYHKKDESSLAHLHLGLLAYQVVSTIRYQLKLVPKDTEQTPEERKFYHCQWKEVVRIMSTQKAVTTIAQNVQDEIIVLRKCSDPNPKVALMYNKLAYRSCHFKTKKFVVHKQFFENLQLADIQEFYSG